MLAELSRREKDANIKPGPYIDIYMKVAVGRTTMDTQPNHILLVTLHHMLYPITVEVLHQVFSPYGYVEKIVTFQKSDGQLLHVFCFYHFSFLLSLLFISQCLLLI